MSIGHVQLRFASGLGVGHTHHAAKELFHVDIGTDVRHRAEHIGKRTVPAFLQGFDSDDVFRAFQLLNCIDIV